MRLYIKLKYLRGEVPSQYNYYLQSAFYNKMPQVLSQTIHDKGFEQGPRRFKLFTFSKLMGDFQRKDTTLVFKSDVSLSFSSPVDFVVISLAKEIMDKPHFRVGKGEFLVDSVKLSEPKVDEGVFYTLSPVTVYKHVQGIRYISPYEPDFQHSISLNAERKLMSLKRDKPTTPLRVITLEAENVSVSYKNNTISAWRGKFKLSGPLSLIKIVYEAGLGSKNSQGFGMIEKEGVTVRE